MFYLNFYNLILNKNLLDYFFLNNFLFYNNFIFNDSLIFLYNNYYYLNFINLYFGRINSYYISDSIETSNSLGFFNILYNKGYSYTYSYFYISNPFILNTSGKLRFNLEYFSYNNNFFFNKESNIWLNYCFFFFENYETTYIRFKKRTTDTVIFSELRLSWYKNFLNQYYNTVDFSKNIETFFNHNYFKFELRPTPLRDVPLKLSNLFKIFIEDVKLHAIYKESPSKIGLNFLFSSGYITNNSLKLENGLKFSLFNNFIFDNFLIEHNNKVYGSYYTREGFKFFNHFDGYRMHNNFSSLFNINQISSKGTRYGYSKMDYNFLYNCFHQKNLSYKLEYLHNTLFFSKLQSSIVFNINDTYFVNLKNYKI